MIILNNDTLNDCALALVDRVDAADPTPGIINIYSAGKAALLISINLNLPAFTLTGIGIVSLDLTGGLSGIGLADGIAAEGYITDGNGVEYHKMTVGLINTEVLISDVNIVTGNQYNITSGTIQFPSGA